MVLTTNEDNPSEYTQEFLRFKGYANEGSEEDINNLAEKLKGFSENGEDDKDSDEEGMELDGLEQLKISRDGLLLVLLSYEGFFVLSRKNKKEKFTLLQTFEMDCCTTVEITDDNF